MELQFEVPKLIGAYVLGNICLALLAGSRIHWAFGVAHFAFAISVLLTGFGAMQLYPFVYWLSALGFALWAIEQPFPMIDFLWKSVAISGFLVAFHAYLQMMGFSWPINYAEGIDSTTPIAFLGQHTKLGAFLAPCASAALALGWLPVCFFISFVALATKSSFTAFSLAIGLGVVYSVKKRISAKPVICMLLVGVSLIFLGPRFKDKIPALDDHGRNMVYRDTLNAWREKPIFGYGPGGFKTLFAGPMQNRVQFPPKEEFFKESMQSQDTYYYGGGWYDNPHNDYLQAGFDMGAWGFGALLIVLFAIFLAYRKEWPRAYGGFYGWRGSRSTVAAMGALAAMLTNALGNFPWLLSPHFMIGVFASAILLRASRA